MRKDFAKFLYHHMSINDKIWLLTGDLGYGLWDKIRLDYPDRFINCMSSEQLMLGCAVGLALENYIPVCYSITPFLLYRPFELIRNYLDHEKINVKLVGGGRDKDYGYLGFSHWAEEDIEVMNTFKNIIKLKPENLSEQVVKEFLYSNSPAYLNLQK